LRRAGRSTSIRYCFLPFLGALLAQHVGFRIRDVLKLLRSTGIYLGSEDAIALVDRDTHQALELSWQQSVATQGNQQLPLFVENLYPILHSIRYPDMTIAIDGHAFRPRKVPRPIAWLAEGTNKLAIGVKNFNAVVHRVRNVQIAFRIHRNARWFRKVSRRS
jgi:hypothetical protein